MCTDSIDIWLFARIMTDSDNGSQSAVQTQ